MAMAKLLGCAEKRKRIELRNGVLMEKRGGGDLVSGLKRS